MNALIYFINKFIPLNLRYLPVLLLAINSLLRLTLGTLLCSYDYLDSIILRI